MGILDYFNRGADALAGSTPNYGGLLSDEDRKAIDGQRRMALAASLLEAGGPSFQPTSFGQALGRSMGAANQAGTAGLDQALQAALLKKQLAAMNKQEAPKRYVVNGALVGEDGIPIYTSPAKEEELPAGMRIGANGEPEYIPAYLTGQERLRRAAMKPEGAAEQWADMSPDEIAAAGLPAGSSAQRNAQTGQINVLSRRDSTGSLSQKDAATAKIKLNSLQLAKQQLAAVKEAFESGRQGINAFGPGQGYIPTEAGKLFDARVDQLRSTITAITRVPGVGAQSDYEAKLDQAKMPSRTDYESSTADKIRGLEDMIALIENGYTDLLSSGSQVQQDKPGPKASASAPKRVRVDAQGNVIP